MKQIIHVLGLSIAVACSAVSASAEELQSPLNRNERPPLCGDGRCGEGEDQVNCPEDCGPSTDENKSAPTCGDLECSGYEDKYSCPTDCGSGELDGCQWLFQIVINVAPELHALFQRNADDQLPCERIAQDCAKDSEFLMSISCNTYAEICKDDEIMCE